MKLQLDSFGYILPEPVVKLSACLRHFALFTGNEFIYLESFCSLLVNDKIKTYFFVSIKYSLNFIVVRDTYYEYI